MPSLERFFDPQIRKFDLNVKPLPGARFYFFENGTTTPKPVYQDKAGTIPHTNPVIADASGSFAPIFLDGLYRVELRSNKNIVQAGWPIDNVGQDAAVVPFGPWVEILPYNEGEIVTGSNGNWYRSIGDKNLGNDPISSPGQWEVIPIPVASTFTSNKPYLSWSDDGEQISLDVDINGMTDEIEADITGADGDFEARQNLSVLGDLSVVGSIASESNITSVGSITSVGDVETTDGVVVIGDGVGPTTYFNNEGKISSDGGNYFDLVTGEDSAYVSIPGQSWISSGSIACTKIGSLVTIVVELVASGSSTTAGSISLTDIIPVGFRPAGFQRKNFMLSVQGVEPYTVQLETVVGTGSIVLERYSTDNGLARGHLTFCFTV